MQHAGARRVDPRPGASRRPGLRPGALRVACVLAVFAVLLVVWGRRPEPPVTVQMVTSGLAVTAPQQVAAVADEVVVAQVVETLGSGMREGVPTTSYRVRVVEQLKGSLSTNAEVTQLGGPDPEHHKLVLVRDDRLLQPGNVCLLATLDDAGRHLVIPVGGNRLLPASDTSTTPWLQYPAVVTMRTAVDALGGGRVPRALPLPRTGATQAP